MSRHTFDAGSRFDQLAPDQADAVQGPAARTVLGAFDTLAVELCDTEAVAQHVQAWQCLARRALEPNIFIEPGFALSAARHFARSHRPMFLLVWARTSGGQPVLIGLCAVQDGPVGPTFASAWTHEQATLSAPLLDRERAEEALEALLDALRRRSPGSAGLLLAGVPQDGALMRLLDDAGRRIAVIEQRTRAVLPRPARTEGVAGLTSKRAKELRRLGRRLAEGGELSLHTARTADEVRAAVERFLELEARGWKGAKGTALLSDPGLATFTRTMTRLLARDGQCAIHTLQRAGQPIAMGIVLTSGDRSYFWKTAYDETCASLSPGKQLTQRLSAALCADPAIALTDSCAVPDHPMIDRMWRDRMIVVDVAVAQPSVPSRVFNRATRRLTLWRLCRRSAKAAFHGGRRLLAKAAAR